MFKQADILHQNAASIEIPTSVLVQAVLKARSIPFDEFDPHSPYFCDEENHPSVLLLSDWWNNNAPGNRRAAFFEIYVRGEIRPKKGEYLNPNQSFDLDEFECWCAYHQSPNMSLYKFAPASTARWRNSILIVFFQTRSAAKVQKQKYPIIILSVDGTYYSDWGASAFEEFYPARDSIVSLKDLPERFPGVWLALEKTFLSHIYA